MKKELSIGDCEEHAEQKLLEERRKEMEKLFQDANAVGIMEFDFPGIATTLLAPAAVAAVTSFIFQTLAKGKVDNYFHRKLEQFKHDLGQATAAAQFDYQRKLHDFQAFSDQRRLVYGEVFKQARALMNTLSGCHADAMNIRKSVSGTNPQHRRVMLNHFQVDAEAMEELESAGFFEQENDDATLMMTMDWIMILFTRRTTERRKALEESLLTNSLFLSRRVNDAAWSFMQKADGFVADDAFSFFAENTNSEPLKESFAKCEAAMREELSRGYYDELKPESPVL